jgi:hypothetical protein
MASWMRLASTSFKLCVFLTTGLGECDWLTGHFIPRDMPHRTHWIGGCVRAASLYTIVERRNICLLGIELWSPMCASDSTRGTTVWSRLYVCAWSSGVEIVFQQRGHISALVLLHRAEPLDGFTAIYSTFAETQTRSCNRVTEQPACSSPLRFVTVTVQR